MRFVYQAQDAVARLVNQLANGLVVKIINPRPFQAFAYVQLLLRSQNVKNKVLKTII